MNLDTFVNQIKTKFDTETALQHRREAAQQIARQYGIASPNVILMFTMKEMARLPLPERCERAGITEEELFQCYMQEGFKRFLEDYKSLIRTSIDFQSFGKLSEAVQRDRYYGKEGEEREDFSIEESVLAPAGKNTVTVPIQMNFYEQARQLALQQRKTEN